MLLALINLYRQVKVNLITSLIIILNLIQHKACTPTTIIVECLLAASNSTICLICSFSSSSKMADLSLYVGLIGENFKLSGS